MKMRRPTGRPLYTSGALEEMKQSCLKNANLKLSVVRDRVQAIATPAKSSQFIALVK